MPLNDFTGWQFGRQSSQTAPDAQGVDRTVGVGELAIVGGDWDGTTLVDGPDAVGIRLVQETTDDSQVTAITQAGTFASGALYDVIGTHKQDLFVVHLQFDTEGNTSTAFALSNGSLAPVSVLMEPTTVTVTVGDAVHVHQAAGTVHDVRIRKSTLTTTWVDGDKIRTLDTPPLAVPVVRMTSGMSQTTNAAGVLMRCDIYPTAMTEPDVEALPNVV